ncbi:MAG TPA: hypothetical protein VFC78_08885 [Tepidisphaeraceae bacterium]|nr:hypothetical protein [Tepidisphaeraceae bacterium]
MPNTLAFLTQQMELAGELLAGRGHMFEPQDLPGRFGRVIKAVDHLLEVVGGQAVLGGGWAVWRHGFHGRMTQDVDIVLAADRVDEFMRAASVSGFEILPQPPGRWPKLLHKATDIKVDILPEGQRPGTAAHPAPTTLGHPLTMGASGAGLRYITLPSLIELKLAAGRARDEADVAELIRANPQNVAAIRGHLATVHGDYVIAFDQLVQRAQDQRDE